MYQLHRDDARVLKNAHTHTQQLYVRGRGDKDTQRKTYVSNLCMDSFRVKRQQNNGTEIKSKKR